MRIPIQAEPARRDRRQHDEPCDTTESRVRPHQEDDEADEGFEGGGDGDE